MFVGRYPRVFNYHFVYLPDFLFTQYGHVRLQPAVVVPTYPMGRRFPARDRYNELHGASIGHDLFKWLRGDVLRVVRSVVFGFYGQNAQRILCFQIVMCSPVGVERVSPRRSRPRVGRDPR